jgi:hypothetical protein
VLVEIYAELAGPEYTLRQGDIDIIFFNPIVELPRGIAHLSQNPSTEILLDLLSTAMERGMRDPHPVQAKRGVDPTKGARDLAQAIAHLDDYFPSAAAERFIRTLGDWLEIPLDPARLHSRAERQALVRELSAWPKRRR